MKRVVLGRSGLEVTPICFGTWQLGGEWGEFDEGRAIESIQRAHELGINFFDTAHGYGWGRSERLLGKALAEPLLATREECVIATKGGLRWEEETQTLHRDSSPEWLRRGVDASLEALGIDYVDLFQVHWPDPETPFADTADTLAELVREGRIRHVGVSNFSAEQMEEFSETLPVETLQPVYHLFRREIEDEVLPYCRRHDIGVLAYGPLAHGLLTGAMTRDQSFPEGDWRADSSVFAGEDFERNLEAVDALSGLAAERGISVSQLATAWVLANPAVHVAIVGTRNPDHIAEAVAAAEVELSTAELARIDGIMASAVQVGGPSPEGGIEP